jgi:hypothetical protein
MWDQTLTNQNSVHEDSTCKIFNIQFATQTNKGPNTVYRTAYLPADLYGCEVWYFTLRGELGLRLFQNRVLRIITRAKRYEVIGE